MDALNPTRDLLLGLAREGAMAARRTSVELVRGMNQARERFAVARSVAEVDRAESWAQGFLAALRETGNITPTEYAHGQSEIAAIATANARSLKALAARYGAQAA